MSCHGAFNLPVGPVGRFRHAEARRTGRAWGLCGHRRRRCRRGRRWDPGAGRRRRKFRLLHETLAVAGPKTTTNTPDEPLLQLPADVDGQASPKKSVRYHGLRNRLAPSWQLSIRAAYDKETTANGPVIKQMLPEANMWRRWMPTRCGIHVVPVISAPKFICHRLDHG